MFSWCGPEVRIPDLSLVFYVTYVSFSPMDTVGCPGFSEVLNYPTAAIQEKSPRWLIVDVRLVSAANILNNSAATCEGYEKNG